MNTFLSGKVIEISGEGYFLKKKRGFLSVLKQRQEIASLPFDDIQSLIFNACDLVYTNKVINELSKRKIPVIFCDNKHLPTSIILPFDSYFHQSRRILLQTQCSVVLNKRLWKQIVISKILQQGFIAQELGRQSEYLFKLAGQVRSNDSTNCEAQAARYYFNELFGDDFCRNRELDGINSMLNYGYIVFRSAVARAVVASGLHPGLGIKHCNPNNSMPLVDDMIEPFRPFVDMAVWELFYDKRIDTLDKSAKKYLVDSLSRTISVGNIRTTPNRMIYSITSELGSVYHQKRKSLDIPPMLPVG
jgi:CRISPR-associated protein Cas1